MPRPMLVLSLAALVAACSTGAASTIAPTDVPASPSQTARATHRNRRATDLGDRAEDPDDG